MKSKILLVAVCISLGLVFIVPQGVLADFYVIPTGTRYVHPELISAYFFSDGATPYYLLMTVPAGKKFILTDVITFGVNGSLSISENSTIKAVFSGVICHIPLNSGIQFSPESEIVLDNGIPGSDILPGHYTISGYLIDN